MIDLLKKVMTGQMLRYQVGKQMWCRGCEGLLDARHAVSMDVSKNGVLTATVCYCADCWDKTRAVAQRNARAKHLELEIVDGRTADEDGHPCEPSLSYRLGPRGQFRTKVRQNGKHQPKEVRGVRVTFIGSEIPEIARAQGWFAYTAGRRKWFLVHETKGAAVSSRASVSLRGVIALAIGCFRRAEEARMTKMFSERGRPSCGAEQLPESPCLDGSIAI